MTVWAMKRIWISGCREMMNLQFCFAANKRLRVLQKSRPCSLFFLHIRDVYHEFLLQAHTVTIAKVFLRGVLLHYFNMQKTTAESHRILVEVYGEHALAERTCQKWFARFKSGDFGLED